MKQTLPEIDTTPKSIDENKVVYLEHRSKSVPDSLVDTLFSYLMADSAKKHLYSSRFKKYKGKIDSSKINDSTLLSLLLTEMDRSTHELSSRLEQIEKENELILERLNAAMVSYKKKPEHSGGRSNVLASIVDQVKNKLFRFFI
jgi:hypothetical protein